MLLLKYLLVLQRKSGCCSQVHRVTPLDSLVIRIRGHGVSLGGILGYRAVGLFYIAVKTDLLNTHVCHGAGQAVQLAVHHVGLARVVGWEGHEETVLAGELNWKGLGEGGLGHELHLSFPDTLHLIHLGTDCQIRWLRFTFNKLYKQQLIIAYLDHLPFF